MVLTLCTAFSWRGQPADGLAVVMTVDTEIITDLSTWQIHSPTSADVLQAIQLQERYQLSFWDAMIITSAVRMGCQTVWSEDLNSGQTYDRVTVINPF